MYFAVSLKRTYRVARRLLLCVCRQHLEEQQTINVVHSRNIRNFMAFHLLSTALTMQLLHYKPLSVCLLLSIFRFYLRFFFCSVGLFPLLAVVVVVVIPYFRI